MRLFIVLISVFTLVSCGVGDKSEEIEFGSVFPNSTAENYFNNAQTVTVEVYYEPGAEPFTGNRPNGSPLWDIFVDNINAMFQYRSVPPTINIPTTLSDMNQMSFYNRTNWTTNDAVNLYRTVRKNTSTATNAVFYIYFVNGNAESGNSVLGFNVNNTPVIMIFKDVVEGSGGPVVQRFVEQSTLVHEMGHALGLVNNGIPQQSNHQDVANGAHTTNSNCVMYYKNEGRSDLASFVQSYIASGNTVMWGPEVLKDVESYSN